MFNRIEEIKPSEGKQELAMELAQKVDFMILGGSRYGGKVQPYTVDIQTPWGKKKLADIKKGDTILDASGHRQTVLEVWPHQDWDFYKITLADGSVTYAGKEHLWLAWKGNRCTKKLRRLYREDPSNKDLTSQYPASASKVSTETLMNWLERGYIPMLPANEPVHYEIAIKSKLRIDPYLLGFLLGDGCLTQPNMVGITRHQEDTYIDGYLQELGFVLSEKLADNQRISLLSCPKRDELLDELEKLKLVGTYSHTKFIPKKYLTLSIKDRQSLLQGLMDTDGYVSADGKLYYYTTSPQLNEDFNQLVRSLGGVPFTTEKYGKYKDKEGNVVVCKKVYTTSFRIHKSIVPFRLERKLERYKPKTRRVSRSIVSIEYSHKADGACLTVSSHNSLYLTDDFIVTHNTLLSAMVSLVFQHDPNFRGIYFRVNHNDLIGAGSLYENAKAMYKFYGARFTQKPLRAEFPSGATVEWSHMALKDSHESHRGKAYSMVCFDEIDQFDQEQVAFLMTCLRSNADMNSFMIGTCNPSKSWTYPLVEWYLSEDGTADPEKCGVIRHFIVTPDHQFVFGESEEFFKEHYNDLLWVLNEKTGEMVYVPPKKFTFVFFNIFDNPIGLAKNPRYLSELKNQPEWKVQRELYGNWKAEPQESTYFHRSWIRGQQGEKVRRLIEIPQGCISMRGLDKAHSEWSESNRDPDYTAWSPRFYKDRNGFYWLVGDFIDELKDFVSPRCPNPLIGQVRRLAGPRDALILKQAQHDGKQCKVVLSKDNGAGAQDFLSTVALLMEHGFKVERDMTACNAADKKLKDFLPFTKACQMGLVFIVEETFPPDTLEAWYNQLERFDGSRKSRKHDDWVDATSVTFNAISTAKRPYKTLNRSQISCPTLSAPILQELRKT